MENQEDSLGQLSPPATTVHPTTKRSLPRRPASTTTSERMRPKQHGQARRNSRRTNNEKHPSMTAQAHACTFQERQPSKKSRPSAKGKSHSASRVTNQLASRDGRRRRVSALSDNHSQGRIRIGAQSHSSHDNKQGGSGTLDSYDPRANSKPKPQAATEVARTLPSRMLKMSLLCNPHSILTAWHIQLSGLRQQSRPRYNPEGPRGSQAMVATPISGETHPSASSHCLAAKPTKTSQKTPPLRWLRCPSAIRTGRPGSKHRRKPQAIGSSSQQPDLVGRKPDLDIW